MFFENKNVLVTGGTGFTGVNLIKRLLDLGANVTATLHRKDPVIVDSRIRYEKVDLTKQEDCISVCKGQDLVFMCAANTSGAAVMEKTPLIHVTPNVLMNTAMLDAAYSSGVKKFLFISSTTVYPLSEMSLIETDATGEFFDKYFCVGSMKMFSETLCKMYSTKIKNPMVTIIVRPGNMYGDYDDFEWETSHSTAALVRRVVERHNPIEVWGDGSDIKDITYISDFIDGLVLAMEKIDKFDIINIAGGHSYSIQETLIMMLMVDHYQDAKIVYDSTKPVMIPKRYIDISKAQYLLGFNPKVSLEEGLTKTIKWYRENKL